jgi:hypothetical protein
MSLFLRFFEKDFKKDLKKDDKDTKPVGYSTNIWLWASKKDIKKNVVSEQDADANDSAATPYAPVAADNQNSIQDEINKLLAENPNINGATLLNLLKSKGFKITKETFKEPAAWAVDEELWDKAKKAALKSYNEDDEAFWPVVVTIYKNMGGSIKSKDKKQADSSSTNIAIQRENLKFLEAAKSGDAVGVTKFKVAILQEGLGNFETAFFYTKKALESAITVFEGKKIYADHPDSIEEKTRPERSVRDVLGHFENVRVEIKENGRAMLVADVSILPDEPFRWARALMRHAIEYSSKYPDKDFIGLSINASGKYNSIYLDDFLRENNFADEIIVKLNEAKKRGIEKINVVEEFSSAVSCDLVTEAGADGKVLSILESERTTKMNEMKQQDEIPHKDEAQDIELIKQMIKKYLGDNASDDEIEASLEAYEYMKQKYNESEKAIEAACEAMKCAKHIAAKKEANKEGEKNEQKEAAKEKETKESKIIKELEKENAELKGKLASFLEKEKTLEFEKFVNEKLSKVKISEELSKELKETMLNCKNKESAEIIFNAFLKGIKANEKKQELDFSFTVEKESRFTESSKNDSLSFSDCLN